jgi:aldehyde:ferredoxin oxidoreductase
MAEYIKSNEEFGPNRQYAEYLFKRANPKKGDFGSIQSRHGTYSPDPYRSIYAVVGDQCGTEPEPYWNYFGGLPSKILIKWLGTDKVMDTYYWGPEVAEACIAHENIAMMTDSLVFCSNLSWDTFQVLVNAPMNRKQRMVAKWDDLLTNSPNGGPEALTAVFGREVTWQELCNQAEMNLSLIRAIWVRDGYTMDGDHDSYWDEVFAEKDDKGNLVLPKDKFEQTMQEYYKLRGWKNGVPTRARLEELGLKDVADELDSMNLLPA